MPVEPHGLPGPRLDATSSPSTTETETLNLLEEVLRVGKREVETGRVRVSVLTDTEQRAVAETLRSRRVDVRRVTLGRHLASGEAMPQSHMDGDELVVPIVEEMLVVEKRLVVTEELRIRVLHTEEQVERTVPLRRQRAVVEQLEPANDDVAL